MGDFICPVCGSRRIHKVGFDKGIRQFRCYDCHKSLPALCPIKPFNPVIRESRPVKDFCFEDDVWDVRALAPYADFRDLQNSGTFNFVSLELDWLKNLAKRYIKHEINAGISVGVAINKLSTFRSFSSYLSDQTNIQGIEEITRSVILSFLSKYALGKQNNTIIVTLGALRHFFETGNLHGWFTVPQHLIRNEDYPKGRRNTPKDIPNCVLEKIINNLHKLPEPLARMWMIGYFCAMRVSELQLCPLDCIRNDSQGNWFIIFWRKKNKDYHTLPIGREIAKLIQQQQKYIENLLGKDFNYLFCDYLGTRSERQTLFQLSQITPVKRIADAKLLSRCINCLINSEKLTDENGQLWHFKTHQLRDTRLTYLFETGHELAVISKWAGHKQQLITQKYVHIKEHTMRKATAPIQAALLNIKGEPINTSDLPETLQQNPNAHTLSYEDHINTPIYGYCGLPLDEDCPHWKACYTCPSFVARRELLPDYLRIRDQLRSKQARAEAQGEAVKVDQFRQQADSLDTIITGFEGVA